MRSTIYDITKRLSALAANTQVLAENIRAGKRSPLTDLDQAKIMAALGNIVDSEVIKICEYVTGLESELEALNTELTRYETKVINLEKEIDSLSIEGYLWK